MRSSRLKWIFLILALSVLSFYSKTSFAQNVDVADLGAKNEFIYKLNGQLVYSMRISATLGDATLTELRSMATSGTYTAGEILNFGLYYNDVNDFSSATLISTSLNSNGGGEFLDFNSFSQTIPGDGANRYLFIAANVKSTAASARTFRFNFFASTNFTWTTAVNVSASLGGSGEKTIQPDAFVTTWDTNQLGIGNDRIFINSVGTGQNYNIYWKSTSNTALSGAMSNRTAPTTVIFPSAGIYQVTITGTFPQIVNGGNPDAPKLISIDHWGPNAWTSMAGAFSQCSNLRIKATDAPNLTGVTSLHQMFQSASSMNDDLSSWDVSTITDMSEVFSLASAFNQDLSSWDVSNVTNMTSLFSNTASFNQPLNAWDVSSVTDMHSMFATATAFNQSLSNWDVSSVTRFEGMFTNAGSFNQPLNTWDVSSATQMFSMFDGATVFNGDISNWNVSNVTSMSNMFSNTSAFNVDIGSWNVSNVTFAPGMFAYAKAFNQSINNWNISNIDDLNNMFYGAAAFNQPLNNWDVSNVLTMSGTFAYATAFNQDLSAWNTGTVEDMSYMFQGANSFNQNISGWNVSMVNNMNNMFSDNIAFDQNLGSWNVGNVSSANHMFDYSALSVANYDNTLIGWSALSVQNYVTLGAAGKRYCAGETARATLITQFWDVIDAGKLCSSNPLITLFIPSSGLPGTTVTIRGTNFNTNASDNAVYFGAVRANVSSATSTQLVVEVPAGATSVAPIIVQDLTTGLQANSIVTVIGNYARQFTVTYSLPKALNYKLKTEALPTGAQANAVAVADFNNDGNPDFATANAGGNSVSIVLGSGSGGFTVMPPVTVSNDPWSITVGDFNNDGNMDFLTGSPVDDCMLNLALGNGDGTFGTPVTISGGGCSITAVAADFNNDGNLDVIAGNNSSNSSRILLGDGTGNLTITATAIPAITQSHSIAVGDFNRDGIADLAIEDLTNMYIRLGVGDGTFSVGSTLTPGDTPFAITTGDFNNDGILDLAEANNISNDVYVFTGDGTGILSFATFITLPSGAQPRSLTVGDFNGDGNADLAIANTAGGSMSIALGNGAGFFDTPKSFGINAASLFPNAIASADFDKDGKADLVTGNSADASIFLMFTPPVITSISPTHGYPGATITINGDNFNPGGANDIYFGAVKVTANANAIGTSITVNVPAGATSVTPIIVRNNANNLQASSLASATPYFVSSLPVSNLSPANYVKTTYSTNNPISVAAADFDNDGYVDLAVPDTGFKNITLLKNDGSGLFTNPWAALVPSVNVINLKAADINGDGNADLIGASTSNTQLSLFLGNGNGSFTHLSDINGVTGNGAGLAIGDVDNDGVSDLITTYTGDQLSVLKGDGSGNFVTGTGSPYTIVGANVPGAVVTADFNNDTYVDIAVTNSNASNIYILLNNQDGTFGTPVSVSTGASAFAIVAGRFDSDNNIDLAVLAYGSSNITLLQGDGSGGFFPFAGSPVAIGGTPLGLYGGDFDGDGITDLIVGGNDQNNIGFFKGNGSGGFAQFSSFPYPISGVQPYGVITADFNNDGRADVATAGSNELNVLLYSSSSFITKWKTTDGHVVIQHGSGSFNYDLTWKNLTNPGVGEGSTTVVSGSFADYAINGLANNDVYQVEISGTFPHFLTGSDAGEGSKLLSIDNWGDMVWENMSQAFSNCANVTYNATDSPNLTNVTDMSWMFASCTAFNGNINNWNTSSVTNMSRLFQNASAFNQPLNNWDVSNVTDMTFLFDHASSFNQNISNWNVSNVTDMHYLFGNASSFNQPLNSWDVSNVIDMTNMFGFASSFNQPLGNWNVNNVTKMGFLFQETPFNQNINGWDVSNVTEMLAMFAGADNFNQPIGSWDVGNVTTMTSMFYSADSFNQPLNSWDVSSVTDLADMFYLTHFNQSLANWNVSNVTNMSYMFAGDNAFNQDISGWDVGNVTTMRSMFEGSAAFNQNLSTWDVRNVTTMQNMFKSSGLSNANYDNILIGWGALSGLQNNVQLGVDGKTYCAGESARAALIASHSWIITDGGKFCPPAPTVTSFTPTSGGTGTTVTITGTDFTGATNVTFGGTNATSFTVINATTITAIVGNGTTGVVSVTTFTGTGTSSGIFTFIPAPIISSFTPISASAGATVTITGTGFTGATTVTFGGTNAVSFTVVNATTITAIVASGTTGSVSVTTPGGTASLAGFTFTPATSTPTISSFTPTSASSGATVTITGTNFTGATAVSFGGVAATSFNVVSSTTITAIVSTGATGDVAITTPGGTATLSGFTFIVATAPIVVVKDGDNNSGSPVQSQPNQAIDLGQTFVGKSITKAFTIENTGTADLQITSITVDNNNFEITEKPTVIAPGSFGRLAVQLKAERIGIYSARIAIQYQSGSFEFSVTGEVKDPSIIVYNAVTPNGDGNHDYLKIVNIELYPGNTVTIINRLGEQVYKVSDYNNDNPAKRFAGEANAGSGSALTDGTYYYIIDIGSKDNYTGFLLLQK